METRVADIVPATSAADSLATRIRMDGYVVLDERLPVETVDRLRDRFDELLAERQAARQPNRGPNRYQMHLPFAPPFADPQIYEHPRVLEVIETLLGPDPICSYYASDTPLPGSDYQR